jgi:hypothetical protein
LEYHGETLHLDPLLLTDKTSKRICILKTVGKLHDSSTSPEIVALKARLEEYAKTTTSAFNAITTKLNKNNHQHQPSQCPPWFSQPPTDPNQTREHDGRTWHWCPKCNASRGGRWVCTHTASTHRNSYTPNNKRERDNSNTDVNKNEEQQALKKQLTNGNTQAAAYLSGLSDLSPEHQPNDTQPYEDEILNW